MSNLSKQNEIRRKLNLIILITVIPLSITPFLYIELLRSTLYFYLPYLLLILIFLNNNKKHRIIMLIVGAPLFLYTLWVVLLLLILFFTWR
ncbi:hypothetical protein SAMN05192535_3948 [Shouchella rhizosphaerae]|nr:hypothetical protein SAMN05192535_3948 [Shouchella rhizosphaerae]